MKTMDRREFMKDGLMSLAALATFGTSFCKKSKDSSTQSKSLDLLVKEAKEFYDKADEAEWGEDAEGISYRDTKKENEKKEMAISKYEVVTEKAKSLLKPEKNSEKIKEYAQHLVDSYYNIGNLLRDMWFPRGKVPSANYEKKIKVSTEALKNIEKYNVHNDYKARLYLRIANGLEKTIKVKDDWNTYAEYLCKAAVEAHETKNRILTTALSKMRYLIENDHIAVEQIKEEMKKPYFAKHTGLIAKIGAR